MFLPGIEIWIDRRLELHNEGRSALIDVSIPHVYLDEVMTTKTVKGNEQ